MSKWKNILIWVTIFTYLIFAMGFITEKENQVICNSVAVKIKNSLNDAFVKKSDIFATIDRNNIPLMGQTLKSINTQSLESLLSKSPFIKEVEVFKSINGAIKIEINQRSPIVRVINNQHRNYYIDLDGVVMPLSAKYTSHVLIVNGNIAEGVDIKPGHSISCQETDNNRMICDIFTLADFIYRDEFWRSQIEQIYVNGKKEFELIPRVGAHVILFGKINDCEEKFQKLKSLYINGFSKTGWNKYVKINLKYKDQVICTKR